MIQTWVADFFDTPAYAELPQPAKEYAERILPVFLRRACKERGVEPAELEEADLKTGLLEGVGGAGAARFGAVGRPGDVRGLFGVDAGTGPPR